MDEQVIVYVILGLCLASAVAYFRWRQLRNQPEDRSQIEDFARSRTLRIISVKRASAYPYWFRGVFVGIDARIYTAIVEDSQGARADVGIIFNSWSESGRLEVLKPHGLALAPTGQAANLKEVAAALPRWSWYERLTLYVLGACISGFAFGSGMRDLAYPGRPKVPDITHGYTHLLSSARYGPVYVTHLEYWAGTYGSKLSLGCAFIVGLFVTYVLKVKRTGTTFVLQIFAAGVISYALYDVIWRAFNN